MLTIVEVDEKKLKGFRELRMLSLRELADLSGVAHNTVWRIEAGRRSRTHPKTIRKLAAALNVDPQELLKGE